MTDPGCLSAAGAAENQCVVLLHGLGRTHRSMRTMAAVLAKEGYTTLNLDYASRKYPIEQLAMQVIPEGLRRSRSAGCGTIHFITHSMGGIVLRYYLTQHSIEELGRVVMLGPPNQGSEVADVLRKNWFYRWYKGPAGQQLGTGPDGIAAKLGPITYPVGIIAGNVNHLFDARLSKMIPGEGDGKVSVARAKARGMADFLVLPYSHTFIMNRNEVIAQTLHFLCQGKFQVR